MHVSQRTPSHNSLLSGEVCTPLQLLRQRSALHRGVTMLRVSGLGDVWVEFSLNIIPKDKPGCPKHERAP